jgi:hypothetical protein
MVIDERLSEKAMLQTAWPQKYYEEFGFGIRVAESGGNRPLGRLGLGVCTDLSSGGVKQPPTGALDLENEPQ